MMILSICDNVDILRIIRIIIILIKIIRIVVPIILILSCMIEGVRAITSHDTDITSKMLKSWVTKAIAALLVFFIPTFVFLIANISNYSTSEFNKCIKFANNTKINELSAELAMKYIQRAKDSLSTGDYTYAKRMVSKVKDKELQEGLLDDLDVVSEYMDIKTEINELSITFDINRYSELKDRIDAITDEEVKEKLSEAFKNIKKKDVGWWWPIGSNDTIRVGNAIFAEGEPASTSITATFDGNDSVHQGYHGALDIGAHRKNVIASKSGTVIYPGPNDRIDYPDQAIKSIKDDCPGLRANYVVIDHGDGFKTQYSHLYMNTITVRAGEHVEQGQVLGLSGSSGCSTGSHLHFQMELNGTKVDPLDYVSVDNPRP